MRKRTDLYKAFESNYSVNGDGFRIGFHINSAENYLPYIIVFSLDAYIYFW